MDGGLWHELARLGLEPRAQPSCDGSHNEAPRLKAGADTALRNLNGYNAREIAAGPA